MKEHGIKEITSLLPENVKRLSRLFDRFRHDLDGALERASNEFEKHMSSKGDVCESAVSLYLSETLGRRYAVTNGFLFDSSGQQSRQQDVIIVDDHWSMRFTPRGCDEPSIVPVETTYATIEVKKTLSSTDLSDAVENIKSVKRLSRQESWAHNITPNWRLKGMNREDNPGVRNKFFCTIFAFSAGRSLDAVFQQLQNEVVSSPPELWPDVIVIHKEGLILPFCRRCNSSGARIADMIKEGCEPGYKIDNLVGEYALLGFHLLLMSHLHYTTLLPLDFNGLYGKMAYATRTIESFQDIEDLEPTKGTL